MNAEFPLLWRVPAKTAVKHSLDAGAEAAELLIVSFYLVDVLKCQYAKTRAGPL